jgi:hypothetical protein
MTMGEVIKGAVLAVVVVGVLMTMAMAPGLEEGSTGLSTDMVLSVVGGALAIGLEVVPGLEKRWEGLPAEVKRFSWLIGCLLVGGVPPLAACVAGNLGMDVSGLPAWAQCSASAVAEGIRISCLAYFASQSAHGLTVGTMKLLGVYERTEV